jgi:transposase
MMAEDTTVASNGFAAAINAVIQTMRRVAGGFGALDNYR